MAKDDVVIGLGRPMYGSSVHSNRKKAYPSVITTLGQMEKEVRRWIAVHNFLCTSYLDADSMMKEYVQVMCSTTPPGGSGNKLEAFNKASISSDKKKHIKFQVSSFLQEQCQLHLRVSDTYVVLVDNQPHGILRSWNIPGHSLGSSTQRRYSSLCHDRWTEDSSEWRVPYPHQ